MIPDIIDPNASAICERLDKLIAAQERIATSTEAVANAIKTLNSTADRQIQQLGHMRGDLDRLRR